MFYIIETQCKLYVNGDLVYTGDYIESVAVKTDVGKFSQGKLLYPTTVFPEDNIEDMDDEIKEDDECFCEELEETIFDLQEENDELTNVSMNLALDLIGAQQNIIETLGNKIQNIKINTNVSAEEILKAIEDSPTAFHDLLSKQLSRGFNQY